MIILGISLGVLLLWWIALSLLVVRDHIRRNKTRGDELPQENEADPHPFVAPKWPSWGDCLARPVLFVGVPLLFLFHVLVMVWNWPCFPIHRLFSSTFGRDAR